MFACSALNNSCLCACALAVAGRCPLKVSRNVVLEDYVVPSNETLTVSLAAPKAKSGSPRDASASGHSGGGGGGHVGADPFPQSSVRISRFHDHASVMHSKAKPKKIALDTTSGEVRHYLCKQEKNGDLRKDARLMEFNAVVSEHTARVCCISAEPSPVHAPIMVVEVCAVVRIACRGCCVLCRHVLLLRAPKHPQSSKLAHENNQNNPTGKPNARAGRRRAESAVAAADLCGGVPKRGVRFAGVGSLDGALADSHR